MRRVLWRLDDYEHPAFTFEEVRRWPKGQLDRFVELGLVRAGGMADGTIYYDCEQHCDIDYDPQTLPNGRVVVTHRCSHGCGLVVLEPERFQLWDIRFDGLAVLLASSLALAGRVESLVPDTLLLLGQHFSAGGPLDVFLARRLGDAETTARVTAAPRIAASNGAVVFVPATLPATPLARRETPTLSLAELLVWPDGDSTPDVTAIVAALQSIRPPTPSEQWLTVTQCAELLAKDLPSIDLAKAKARVSKAASSRKLTTNGKARDERRIEQQSFDAWRLQQRDRDLDAADDS
ncbi:MAG: hypothetical protein U1D55_13770 [Phycisphaerae bacterium]